MSTPKERRSVTYRAGLQDRGKRLDLFLKERIPRLSREGVKKAIRSRVLLAGRTAVRPSTQLRAGDEVVVAFPDPEDPSEPRGPHDARIPVLHDDPWILVVDKPAGLRVHANASSPGPSLLGRLAARHGGELKLVHRLDKDTSGVTILARTLEASRALSRAFAGGKVEKVYTAVVFGAMDGATGVIDLPLGKARGSSVHIKQDVDLYSGRRATSVYKVLERLEGFTVVEVRPRTGRRHQIRVHLKAIGHPVVGDKLYAVRESHHIASLRSGVTARMLAELGAQRQLLHAARIRFPHPGDGRRIAVEAPLPEDMLDFSRRHRRHGSAGRERVG